MTIFYDENGVGKDCPDGIRPEGYADAANGWVDPNPMIRTTIPQVSPEPVTKPEAVKETPKPKKKAIIKKKAK